jgi:hypothetical protein
LGVSRKRRAIDPTDFSPLKFLSFDKLHKVNDYIGNSNCSSSGCVAVLRVGIKVANHLKASAETMMVS